MAELEIHQEHQTEKDPMGKKVGVLAAVLAVFLAIVTIQSHRAHTEAILAKTNANDQWNFYQAERLKAHNLQMGQDLITLLAKGDGAEKKLTEYSAGIEKYEHKAKELREKADKKEEETERAEHKALYFDLGEGLLEIALVLSSLYFIARKMLFPVIGVIAGLAGVGAGAAGFIFK